MHAHEGNRSRGSSAGSPQLLQKVFGSGHHRASKTALGFNVVAQLLLPKGQKMKGAKEGLQA